MKWIIDLITSIFSPKPSPLADSTDVSAPIEEPVELPRGVETPPALPPEKQIIYPAKNKWSDAAWKMWQKAKIRPEYSKSVKRYADICLQNLPKYTTVAQATGIPEWVIAALHMRESSSSFAKHLANGDPLWDSKGRGLKTVSVPKGLGPFKTWEESAIAALKHEKWKKVKQWDIVTTLLLMESFNGLGYRNKNVPSPYIWSFTDQYIRGKYVADGKYSSTAVDKQCGCAALILELRDRGLHILEVPPV